MWLISFWNLHHYTDITGEIQRFAKTPVIGLRFGIFETINLDPVPFWSPFASERDRLETELCDDEASKTTLKCDTAFILSPNTVRREGGAKPNINLR